MGYSLRSRDESENSAGKKLIVKGIGAGRSCLESLQETQLLSAESEGAGTGSHLVEGRELLEEPSWEISKVVCETTSSPEHAAGLQQEHTREGAHRLDPGLPYPGWLHLSEPRSGAPRITLFPPASDHYILSGASLLD